ncbi:unnamed protein product [Mucor hiemalis]
MDPLMYKKWDHSGYEELLKLEEREEKLKREAIENGQEYENDADYTKSNQRSRGNYSSRGGYQRYQNFNNHNRNRNYHNRQPPKTGEEWPVLSNKINDADTPIIVENLAWATATPELLQSHDNGPFTNTLVDIEDTEPVKSTIQNKDPETIKDLPIVNAWGSISRAEESETLNQNSDEIGWGVETKVFSSDDLGKSDSGIIGWGNETVQPSSGGWEQQAPASVAFNNEIKESSPSTNDWNNDTVVNGWTNTFTTTNNDSQTNANQQMVTSTWTEEVKTTEVRKEWSDNNVKEQVPYQFMDAESQIGSPNLITTEKAFIPIEEKASNSWAEMSANAEPEKIYSNNYRRHRNTFSPNERSFTPRGGSNFEENKRGGFRNHNDRGFKTPITHESPVGWDTTPAPSKSLNETSYSGWDTTPVISQDSSSNWGSFAPVDTPAPAESSITVESANTELSSPAKSDTTGWNVDSTSPAQDSRKIASPVIATENNASGWGLPANPTKSSNSGWATSPVDASKSGWGSSPAQTETISKSNNPPVVSEPFSSRWGQSNEHSSKSRQNGWSTNQSSSSTNWNADKKARMNKQIDDQPRKGRGYLSQKLETALPVDDTPASVTEEYPNHGDSDSDVEIILEAEEEPDWVKNEQILGMTAPGEELILEESPKARENYTRSYENSSPQPELSYRNSGKGYNQQRKPRRNFDENWRQRDEVLSDNENRAVPMYYPQPHHHINTGNISYLPMIPNGPNGSPMYAMPFPMGMPSSSPIGGSTSPNNSVGGSDSSPHINNNNIKFYSPMIQGPNGLQLPPGYEANGMVYYGMDPSSMYGAPQPFYYYGPPVPGNAPPMFPPQHRLSPNDLQNDDDLVEDGWGPPPDVANSEEQWNNRKPSPTGNYHNSSAYYVYRHQ